MKLTNGILYPPPQRRSLLDRLLTWFGNWLMRHDGAGSRTNW